MFERGPRNGVMALVVAWDHGHSSIELFGVGNAGFQAYVDEKRWIWDLCNWSTFLRCCNWKCKFILWLLLFFRWFYNCDNRFVLFIWGHVALYSEKEFGFSVLDLVGCLTYLQDDRCLIFVFVGGLCKDIIWSPDAYGSSIYWFVVLHENSHGIFLFFQWLFSFWL